MVSFSEKVRNNGKNYEGEKGRIGLYILQKN